MSRRNPRIRPNSLAQRNARALQTLLDEQGSEYGVEHQWHPHYPCAVMTAHLIDATVIGRGRKWRGLHMAVTHDVLRVGDEQYTTIHIRTAFVRATTPRAAYLKSLWSKP